MKFVKLTREEYAEFQEQSGCRNFLNSIEAIDLQEKQGWHDVELVGVKDTHGQVVAAAGLALRPAMKVAKYCLSQRGPLMDYNDAELVKFFTRELKRYLKKKGVLYLEISPIVPWRKLDLSGKVIKGTENDTPIKNLLAAGFLRRPNSETVDCDVEIPREYVLPLTRADGEFYTKEEFLRTIDGSTRRWINRLDKYGVKVRALEKKELGKFRQILAETAERRKFEELVRDLKHYEDEFEAYGERVKFYLSYIDCPEYLAKLEAEREKLEAERERLVAKIQAARAKDAEAKVDKIENQIKVIDEGLNGNTKQAQRVAELRDKYGDTVDLSAAMFIDFPNEMVYLSSGSREELREFNGPLAIQWWTIQKCLEKKIPIYNFYGISGDFSTGSDEAGVLGYKANFRGEIVEKIGEFYLPVRDFWYFWYRKLKRRGY